MMLECASCGSCNVTVDLEVEDEQEAVYCDDCGKTNSIVGCCYCQSQEDRNICHNTSVCEDCDLLDYWIRPVSKIRLQSGPGAAVL